MLGPIIMLALGGSGLGVLIFGLFDSDARHDFGFLLLLGTIAGVISLPYWTWAYPEFGGKLAILTSGLSFWIYLSFKALKQ